MNFINFYMVKHERVSTTRFHGSADDVDNTSSSEYSNQGTREMMHCHLFLPPRRNLLELVGSDRAGTFKCSNGPVRAYSWMLSMLRDVVNKIS